MNRFIIFWLSFLIVCTISVAKNKTDVELKSKKDQIQQNLLSNLGNQNIQFEKNNGQYSEEFQYRFNSSNACVDFYSDKIVFGLRKVVRAFNPQKIEEPMLFDYVVWEIELKNALQTQIVGSDVVNHANVSYFDINGKRISKTTTDKICYKNIYSNIDLVFYRSAKGELKYDFILHAGAKLSDIQLQYNGIENLNVTAQGKLEYDTKWGSISEDIPFSYIEQSGEVVNISYQVDNNILSFSGISEEINETIVLDPIHVDWSTYFYGNGNNGFSWAYTSVYDLDIDDDDNVYITGITNDRFPGIALSYDTSTNGYYDAFVCKMAPAGDSIIWFSYLGGSSYEYCFTLIVNQQQQPVVSGFTWSTDFPTTPGAFNRNATIYTGGFYQYLGFVTKFSENGDSLVFSTFLGGNGSDLIHSMCLDDSNNIYIAGETRSSDFPVTANCFQSTYAGNGSGGSYWTGGDGFLTKMKPDGTGLIFSTYVGGYEADAIYEVALSPNKDIYIVGKTASGNFPVTAGSSIFNYNVLGSHDGFICKFKPDGRSMHYSKMMGGSAEDWFEGVYVNDKDEAYVAGITRSSNFYTTSKAYQKQSGGGADVILVKFNALGQNVVYSTYIGGSGDELYYSGFIYNSNVRVAANVREEAIVCGITRSNNFPVTSDALMTSNPSSVGSTWWNTAATITKLDYKGEKLLYGTYYGGSNYEVPGANKLKRISCYTNILYGGFTSSSDYPTTSGVYKESKSSSSTGFFWTGFVSKFRDTLYTDLISLSLQDTIVECDNVFEILNAQNIGADILWSNGSKNQYQIIQDTGTLWVRATYGCDTVSDTIHFKLEYSPKIPVLPGDSIYCDNFPTLNLDAQNDSIMAKYLWDNGDTTRTRIVNDASKYWVRISTPNCGTKTDTVTYWLRETPKVNLPTDSTFCDDIVMVLSVGDSFNFETYKWNTGDSTSFIQITDTGSYKVLISNSCGVDSAEMNVDLLKTPTSILPADTVFCNTIGLPLKVGTTANAESYLFSDITNSTSFSIADSVFITNPGFYEALVSNGCGSAKDSIRVGVINTPEVMLPADTTLCNAVNLQINAETIDNEEQYVWNDNSTYANRTLYQPGTYWLKAENKCGSSTDTFDVKLVISPTAHLPKDTVFCNVINYPLDATIAESSDYLWNTGSTSPTITATTEGVYRVTISNYCGSSSDSIVLGLLTTPTVNLGEDKVFCGFIPMTEFAVGKENNDEDYVWSNGSFSDVNSFNTAGLHWVEISNKCGTASDSVRFTISDFPQVDLGTDTTLCGNFKLVLDAGNAGMNYLWEPYGETTQTIEATEQRVYKVTVTNEFGCSGSDAFEIDGGCLSFVNIPTAFTPNNDGLNDVFKPMLINYERYELIIYNRWGEQLFYTINVEEGWDGTYKGETVPNGMYMYKMRFITTENLSWRNENGTVSVVR